MSTVILTSPDRRLRAEVSSAGGILTSLQWKDADNVNEELLYQAPWLKESIQYDQAPALVQRLAGEWVGVPFGCVENNSGLFLCDAPHGLPVNDEWSFESRTDRSVTMHYVYPADYPLQSLERGIRLTNKGAEFTLAIHARESCRFPLGLHPIFPVGGAAGDVEIEVNGGGIVNPGATASDISRLAPGVHFSALHSVPASDGAPLNISRLPLCDDSEEIVQLLQPQGCITLLYRQRRLQLTLRWDPCVLPNCLLWISNAGRHYSPWNGRNYCLGVEPVCSAWDLGPQSLEDNPISRTGAPTAISVNGGEALTLNYQIYCNEIK
ncbi:hypothetical protein OIP52_000568 [Salmonella enterica]|nr:hypothetical protein [Salmonella enterica]